MRLERTAQFKRDFVSLPEEIRRRIEKQLAILLQNPRHPSLRIKRMEGIRDIWEGRITKSYRFTFQMKGYTCILRRVGRHDILETP